MYVINPKEDLISHATNLLKDESLADLKFILQDNMEIRMHKSIASILIPNRILTACDVLYIKFIPEDIGRQLKNLIYTGSASFASDQELSLFQKLAISLDFVDKISIHKKINLIRLSDSNLHKESTKLVTDTKGIKDSKTPVSSANQNTTNLKESPPRIVAKPEDNPLSEKKNLIRISDLTKRVTDNKGKEKQKKIRVLFPKPKEIKDSKTTVSSANIAIYSEK